MTELENKNKINPQTYTTNTCYKTTILFLATFFCAIFINTPTVNAKMLNKFKKGFYFEKYSTAEEAKNELLKLHPIGSDFEDVIKTLERAGAEAKKENLDGYRKFKEYDPWWEKGIVKMYRFKYSKASPFFVIINWLEWSGTIQIDKNNKIIDIGIHRGRSY